MKSIYDRRRLAAVVAAISLTCGLPAQATVVLGGSNCSATNLATTGTATAQVIIGCVATGSLEVNASTEGNGITTANANGTGSISLMGGFGAAGDGSILVNGDGLAGSAVLNSNRGIELGNSGGTATITVQNGGLVQIVTDDNGVTLGLTDSTGEIVVDGPNSVLNSKRRIRVGTFDNSTGTLTISNGGLVQITGTTDNTVFTGGATNSSGEIIVTGGGSTLATAGVAIGNGVPFSGGSLTVDDGATVTIVELIGANSPGLSVGGDGPSAITVTGTGSNIQVDPITTGFFAGAEINIGGFGVGSMLIDDFATVNASGANVNVSGGIFGSSTSSPAVLTVSNGASLTADSVDVYLNGTLNGNGSINAPVNVLGGTVAPGTSPGTLTIDGDYSQDADSRLIIEIAGSLPGAYDVLNITGEATFDTDTTIELSFIEGFAPSMSEQYDFLVADTFTNDLSGVNFAVVGLLPGFDFDIDLSQGNTVSVVALNDGVSATGDIDGDGVIDAIDNCTNVSNPQQIDADGDGHGNLCDADFNNSCGPVNFLDLQIMKTGFFTADSVLDLDSSGGPVNFVDLAIMSNLFFLPPGPSAPGSLCNP